MLFSNFIIYFGIYRSFEKLISLSQSEVLTTEQNCSDLARLTGSYDNTFLNIIVILFTVYKNRKTLLNTVCQDFWFCLSFLQKPCNWIILIFRQSYVLDSDIETENFFVCFLCLLIYKSSDVFISEFLCCESCRLIIYFEKESINRKT